jgi:hypothetical protein
MRKYCTSSATTELLVETDSEKFFNYIGIINDADNEERKVYQKFEAFKKNLEQLMVIEDRMKGRKNAQGRVSIT